MQIHELAGLFEDERQQVKMEEKAMRKSTALIKFFIQVTILAAAYAASGLFSEDGEDLFEVISLDETVCCAV